MDTIFSEVSVQSLRFKIPIFRNIIIICLLYIMQNKTKKLTITRRNKKMGGKWSIKYKKSINCNRPKGFSQKQHCKYGRKKYRK